MSKSDDRKGADMFIWMICEDKVGKKDEGRID
jgi:hypothetical protein